jgi:short-chain Z-isoprenyl diphosphate synthase
VPTVAGLAQPAGRAVNRGRRSAARSYGFLRSALLAPVYAYYTARLRHGVKQAVLPHHVALIIDGNRRWAFWAGLDTPDEGHRHGADKIDELLHWCSDLGIPEVTVWALSGENLSRPAGELDPLVEVVGSKLEELAESARDPHRPLRIRVIGRTEQLPGRLRDAIARARDASAKEGLRLNVAIGYSGRDELVDACRQLVDDLASEGVSAGDMAEHVTHEALEDRLYTAGARDPDLIIRTSGELRLSGFLPWQSAHSEFYFTDVYWPAFRELDFLRAVRAFQQRERRYGR